METHGFFLSPTHFIFEYPKDYTWNWANATYTWNGISSRKWGDFRLTLMDTETQQTVRGVSIMQSGHTIETITEMEAQGVGIVQSSVVMQTRTEVITSIVVSERDYKTEMLKYLPLYERKSSVFHEVLTTFDREMRNIEQQLEILDRNIFLDTAIESLHIFERDLGIETLKTLRYDQRREQISSRNRANFDQTTEETIKNASYAYGNGEVEVDKTDVAGVYNVTFVGKGIPNNLDGLKKTLDIIVPAHLELQYVFTFSPWQDIREITWGDAAEKTWDELRIWDEVG